MATVEITTFNERFNADDADLTIRSSDGQLFRVHARNLHEHSEAFPEPSEVQSQPEEIVSLPETAATLELLFQFMYRQPQPNLHSLSSDQFSALTEAVEKYGVYPAQQLCRLMMSMKLPVRPLMVLGYALRHNHRELVDEAARRAYAQWPPSRTAALEALGELYIGRWDSFCENIRVACRSARQAPSAEEFMHKGGKKKCKTWGTFYQSINPRIQELCLTDSFDDIFGRLEEFLDDCPTCYQRARRWRKTIITSRNAIRSFPVI